MQALRLVEPDGGRKQGASTSGAGATSNLDISDNSESVRTYSLRAGQQFWLPAPGQSRNLGSRAQHPVEPSPAATEPMMDITTTPARAAAPGTQPGSAHMCQTPRTAKPLPTAGTAKTTITPAHASKPVMASTEMPAQPLPQTRCPQTQSIGRSYSGGCANSAAGSGLCASAPVAAGRRLRRPGRRRRGM